MSTVSAVVTTCRRSPEIVLRAVRSLVGQTFQDLEIIVVDDSPEDFPERDAVRDALKALEAAEGRSIRIIRHETCRGACAARNTGLQAAGGEFIGFLDDDDEWLPEKTEVMLPLFDSPDIALVYCDNILVNDLDGTEELVRRPDHGPRPLYEMLCMNFIGSTSFPLLRRSCLLEIGGFDEEMLSAQDADVWVRLIERFEVRHLDHEEVRYHVHGGVQISTDVQKKIAGLERFNEKNRAYIEANPEVFRIRLMKLIPFYLRDGQKKKAFRTWRNAVKKDPMAVRGNLGYLKKIMKAVFVKER